MPPQSRFTFSLATLMFATTLIAVVVGLCVSVPWLGIPLTVLMLPAWLRTVGIVKLRGEAGIATSGARRAQIFFDSLALSILFAVGAISGAIALLGVCVTLALCFNHETTLTRDAIVPWLLWTAACTAVTATTWRGVILWPRKRYLNEASSAEDCRAEKISS